MNKYFKNEFETFVNQIKNIDIKYLHVLLSDVLFVALSFLAFILWGRVMSNQAGYLPSDLQNIPNELIASASANIRNFLIVSVISTILLIAVFIVIFSFTQGFNWNLIFNKKPTKEFYKRFILLNIPVFIAQILIIFIAIGLLANISNSFIMFVSKYSLSTTINGAIAFLFGVLFIGPIALYLMNISSIIYIYFIQSNKILASIINAFKYLFNEGFMLYVPFVMSVLLFYVISAILLLLRGIPMLYNATAILFILLFFNFMRNYLKEIVGKK